MFYTITIILIIGFIDWYFFKALRLLQPKLSARSWLWFRSLFWGMTLVTMLLFFIYKMHRTAGEYFINYEFEQFLRRFIFLNYGSKLVGVLLLVGEDIYQGIKRFFVWIPSWLSKPHSTFSEATESPKISRSEFLSKAAILASTAPLALSSYGILSGAHDYQIRRLKIYLPQLPSGFDGLRIGQISDVHTGSFFNKIAVEGGLEMLLQEKTDLIFFTGDLVNYEATELEEYFTLLRKVQAPMGVYSVLGNHDYGSYKYWSSPRAKAQNLKDVIEGHRLLGWNLLVDEHRLLQRNGEKLAILGVGNLGKRGRSSREGDLSKAYRGTEEAATKLLLSHDPSHWGMEVIKDYQDIDITFSGHTHGMQMGIEVGNFQWSPIQYVYEHWAGHYQQDHQHIYVNRGFGYADIFPCRVGVPPEITVIELKKA